MILERDVAGTISFADYRNGDNEAVLLRVAIIDATETERQMDNVFEARAGRQGYIKFYVKDQDGKLFLVDRPDDRPAPAEVELNPCHVVISPWSPTDAH